MGNLQNNKQKDWKTDILLNQNIIFPHKSKSSLPGCKEIFVKQAGLIISLAGFMWSLYLLVQFQEEPNFFGNYKFLFSDQYPIGFQVGYDSIGLSFLVLTTFVIPFCFLVSIDTILWQVSLFVYCILTIEALLILAFSATDLFMFYLVFEALLIPMFFLIGIWGSRERKTVASFYLFLYTLFGSLIMLSGIIYIMYVFGRVDLPYIRYLMVSPTEQFFLFWAFFLGFGIKVPIYPMHLWLLEAHVEAPTAGSIILAGLLLKLGGFGLLRFVIPMFPEYLASTSSLVINIAFISVLLGSLAALRQTDFKRLIAYSSIAHMNLSLAGLFTLTHEGISGAVYSMWAHGITSSALFALAGVIYSRYGTRTILYYGGLAKVMPYCSFFLFFFCISNIGFPGSSNFVGELLVFLGLIYQVKFTLLVPFVGVTLCVGYTMLFFNRVSFGTLKTFNLNKYADLSFLELSACSIFVATSLFLGLIPNYFLQVIDFNIYHLLYLMEKKLDCYFV